MSDKKAEYQAPSHPPPGDGETRPLPEGWTKQYDSSSNAWFYVDTKTSPPRSIWVHPFDDPGYLEKHPDAKNYHEPAEYQPPSSPPPIPSASHPNLNAKGKAPEKRGFLGKLKDKAIGSKEEREAAKRLREQERRERLVRQQAHAAQYGAPPQVYQQYPGGGYQQGGYQQGGYQQGGYGQPMYGQQPPRRGGGLGGGGMALPLIGGMAGGLLLGEAMGGDGFGGDGGGDFGGGDFGGGGDF